MMGTNRFSRMDIEQSAIAEHDYVHPSPNDEQQRLLFERDFDEDPADDEEANIRHDARSKPSNGTM